MNLNPSILEIPFVTNLTPRAQIEAALAKLPPHHCVEHPHECLSVQVDQTVMAGLRHACKDSPVDYTIRAIARFQRCPNCLYNTVGFDGELLNCAIPFEKSTSAPRDQDNQPLPYVLADLPLDLDRSAHDQFEAWLGTPPSKSCPTADKPLNLRNSSFQPRFTSLIVMPKFQPCQQCGMEKLGIGPDGAFNSFENFIIREPELSTHLATCREFAKEPKGIVVMLGLTGRGKTHLAISVLREFLGRCGHEPKFTKHRHFIDAHRQAHMFSYTQTPMESPLASYQQAGLLVYDELTSPDGRRDYEDVLLDLFEYRIAHFLPSIITANLERGQLESALGSRLHDRLRRATYAVLEFGGPIQSKRAELNADYLQRCKPIKPPPPPQAP